MLLTTENQCYQYGDMFNLTHIKTRMLHSNHEKYQQQMELSMSKKLLRRPCIFLNFLRNFCKRKLYPK